MDPFDELRRYRTGSVDVRQFPEKMEAMARHGHSLHGIGAGDDIIVTADMPGVEKGDIRINVTDDNVLEMSAEKKTEAKKEEKGYIRHERSYSGYYRAIRLPVPVDKTKAKAGYNSGVPEISIPMVHKTSSSEIPVG